VGAAAGRVGVAVTHWTANRIELLGQDHPRLENPGSHSGHSLVPLDTLTDRRAAKRNCAQPAAAGRIVHMAAECHLPPACFFE